MRPTITIVLTACSVALWAGCAKSNPKKVRLDRLLCQKDTSTCITIGLRYQKGRGDPEDMARARWFFRKACEGGARLGCVYLGVMWKRGEGGPKDPSKPKHSQRELRGGDFPGLCSSGQHVVERRGWKGGRVQSQGALDQGLQGWEHRGLLHSELGDARSRKAEAIQSERSMSKILRCGERQ